jgi:hypothetical protein
MARIAARDRGKYAAWSNVPPALRAWWEDRADLPEFRDRWPSLDWSEVKAAASGS